MQPIRILESLLSEYAKNKRYLFTASDLRSLFHKLSDAAFKTLLSRSVDSKILTRLCRGLYLFEKNYQADGLLLFHTAALLRAQSFNYISLETILSEAGIISQIPINWISIMSSGRSNIIQCGQFGTIEYIHTNQKPSHLKDELTYDKKCGFWKASVKLALRDMKMTKRDHDLINWDMINDSI